MKTFVILTLLVASSFFVASTPVSFAADVSKQKAASIAKSQYPGRVIDVKPTTSNGAAAFRVKILDKSGGMHIVIVSKSSGAVLSSH